MRRIILLASSFLVAVATRADAAPVGKPIAATIVANTSITLQTIPKGFVGPSFEVGGSGTGLPTLGGLVDGTPWMASIFSSSNTSLSGLVSMLGNYITIRFGGNTTQTYPAEPLTQAIVDSLKGFVSGLPGGLANTKIIYGFSTSPCGGTAAGCYTHAGADVSSALITSAIAHAGYFIGGGTPDFSASNVIFQCGNELSDSSANGWTASIWSTMYNNMCQGTGVIGTYTSAQFAGPDIASVNPVSGNGSTGIINDLTPITGLTSLKFVSNHDYNNLSAQTGYTVSAVSYTSSSGASSLTTTSAHGLSVGQQFTLYGVYGQTALNSQGLAGLNGVQTAITGTTADTIDFTAPSNISGTASVGTKLGVVLPVYNVAASITYNNQTGLGTITTDFSTGIIAGYQFGLTGQTGIPGLNGTLLATTGTSGTTIYFQALKGLSGTGNASGQIQVSPSSQQVENGWAIGNVLANPSGMFAGLATNINAGSTFGTYWNSTFLQTEGLNCAITEGNTIANGGQYGLSDRMIASAYYVAKAIQLINNNCQTWLPHNALSRPYSAFVLQADETSWGPGAILYGMILVSKMENQPVVPVQVTGQAPISVLGALNGSGFANFLVVNESSAPVTITPQQNGTWNAGTALIVGAPSYSAWPSQMTLGGAPIGIGGTWKGSPLPFVKGGSISIPGYGSAFISITS